MTYVLTMYSEISLFFASLSTLCALLTLFLLYDLNRWTGFSFLVCALTTSQLVYDVGFFIKPNLDADQANVNTASIFSFYLLQISGGLATTLFTNVISYIVVVIALTLKSFDIKQNLSRIILVVSLLSVLPAFFSSLGVIGALGKNLSTPISNFLILYYYAIIRVLSIVFNFGCYVLLAFKLRRMGWTWTFNWLGSSKAQAPMHPVCVLSTRMIYYPVVQVLTRLPAAWLEFGYDMTTDDAEFESLTHTTAFKTANTLYCISGPSAGIGFLLIFLLFNLEAYKRLMYHIFWLFPCLLTLFPDWTDRIGQEYMPVPGMAAYGDILRSPLIDGMQSPRLTPASQAPSPYIPNPSVNEEMLRNTSSERSSMSENGGDPTHKASFASRSSHYFGESYNYAVLDDDQLAALVDRFDSSDYSSYSNSASSAVSGGRSGSGLSGSLINRNNSGDDVLTTPASRRAGNSGRSFSSAV